jgi:hypothetical protein
MRRPALILGALVIVAAALAVWWTMRAQDESSTRPATFEVESQDEGPAPLHATSVPAIHPRPFDPAHDAAASESAAPTLDPNQIHVTGKVVDERRRPLPQASIEVVLEKRPPLSGKTGVDGRFRLPVGPKSAAVAPRGAVQAFDGRGRTTLATVPPPFTEVVPGDDLDLGTLALSDGGPLTVRVLKDGAGVAGARVYFGSTRALGSGPFLTDAQGTLGPRKIPEGAYLITAFSNDLAFRGQARAEVPRSDGTQLDVVLVPSWRLSVVVKDAVTGRGVEGQTVEVTGVVRTTESVSWRSLTMPHDPILPTDASGRTMVSGIPTGRSVTVEVVPPDGSDALRFLDDRPRATAEPGAEEVVIVLGTGGETFTFPIVPDETDGPRDGGEVTLSVFEGHGGAAPPSKGKVAGRNLVIDRISTQCSNFLATAADGSVAHLSISKEARSTGIGSDAKFKRLRVLVVEVRDRKGTPLAGIVVQCRTRGNVPIGRPARTGADGTARLEGLFPQRVDVSVLRRGESPFAGSAVAAADLTKPGDGRIEIVLEAERRCVLHVTVDGEKRLPPTISVMMTGGGGRPGPRPVGTLEEDPYAATVSFAFRPDPNAQALSLYITGKGFAATTVPLVLPADENAAFDANVALVTGAKVRVHVLPPADNLHGVAVETWDEKRGSWTPRRSGRGFDFFEEPERKSTEVEVDALAAGRYRARDSLTGIATEAVDVAAGRSVDLTIDLSKAGQVTGRVEGPAEGDWDMATIVVEAPGLVGGSVGPWGGRMPGQGGTRTKINSDFNVRVPGDRPVTIRVTHPMLTAAPDAGSATVTAAGSKVVLRLDDDPRRRSGSSTISRGTMRRLRDRGIVCCCLPANPRAIQSIP